MENELINCPYCGSKSVVINQSQIMPQIQWQVYCSDCGCGTIGYQNKEKSIKIWNTRVAK